MMFLTKMDGYQKKTKKKRCDKLKNMTKIGVIIKAVYYT